MLKLEHFQNFTDVHSDWLWLIVALPLLGAVINGLLTLLSARKVLSVKPWVYAAIGCGAAISSFVVSWEMFSQFKQNANNPWVQELFNWIESGAFHVSFNLELNSLSGVMIVFVTFLASLIHLYSAGYMKGDEGFGRYFTYLNLFLFSMLMLVLAQDLLVLFLGWEGVGFCSYLLIGFWFEDVANAEAGKKAIILNRIGDAGFIAGLLMVFALAGTFNFNELLGHKQVFTEVTATIICFCFFFGAAGKSAQIPLYVWLPDAMAGPTPVSALIHAATMVTAGVYLIARLHFLYVLAPWASTIIAIIGVLTALFAASIALVQNDIKKILAYSTISQLGYMFLGVGVTSYESGIFHLITHGFFKACLFLAAGSVIHALSGEQDIRKMGGLLKHIPLTSVSFLFGWIAITGIVPTLGGFFSKDEILWKALATPNSIFPFLPQVLYFGGLVAAFLTAFYMTRLVILVFFGKYRGEHDVFEHIHESPAIMTWPVFLLGLLSLFIGWIGVPAAIGGADELGKFLDPLFHLSTLESNALSHNLEPTLMAVSWLVACLGVGLACYAYGMKPAVSKNLAQWLTGLKKVLDGKYFVDEFYQATVVRFAKTIAKWVSGWLIEGLLVNRLVELSIQGVTRLSGAAKQVQLGFVRVYLVYIAAGAALLIYLLVH
ncbi:MAG TPA: NADH-quinone oxidoreductase subunit L [bacterium]|jgi:NADH-quinone oxidoreductase subunit L|nr:NADH-quinone oxidoreductase subunit L [bacterium]